MPKDDRRFGGWILPAIVILAGAYFLISAAQRGNLSPVTLKPINWTGLAAVAVGAILALFIKKPWFRLAGILLCAIGAILVICL